MAKKQILPDPTFSVNDAILAGILKAKGCRVDPVPDGDGKVIFIVHGDESTLNAIYLNEPIGSRDVLEGVKSCRSAIFTLRKSS